MSKDLHTGIISTALQNTFDVLYHDILLKKNDCSGFKKPVIKWFKSNLFNIQYFVSLEGVFSEEGLITKLWSSSRFYFTTTSIFNSY